VTGFRHTRVATLAGPAVLGLVLLLAPKAGAAGIVFRNDLKIPVIVQGESIVNRMIQRGRPVVIFPGRTAADPLVPPGNRRITVYDANQPNRVLFRRLVPFPGTDLHFAIVRGPGGHIHLQPMTAKHRRP
jgi:hypothetical protein